MRAGYLGPEGTFTHEALLASPFSDGFDLVGLPTVHDTIVAVQEGTIERALVPIENSIEGGVGATFDTLATEAREVGIVGEVVHAVRHCVIAREPVELGDVRTVISHPQATAQCSHFIRDQLPGAAVVAARSTAEAVRLVAEGSVTDTPAVALGTRAAAALYGAIVLREEVEDAPGNFTRFVWLARRGTDPATGDGPTKTTLVWWGDGDDAPGWLVRCLAEFAFRGVNLTRIQLRPRRDAPGHYMFFADLEGGSDEPTVAQAIEGLRTHADTVGLLGSYPAAVTLRQSP